MATVFWGSYLLQLFSCNTKPFHVAIRVHPDAALPVPDSYCFSLAALPF